MEELKMSTKKYQLVECIVPNHFLQLGNHYLLDLFSLWCDCDGDAYANVYKITSDKSCGCWVGRYKLTHFWSITNLD